MREEEEEAITNVDNVTADTSSLAFSPHEENSNAVFASKKLENPNMLVNAVANITINDVGCELKAATASDAQVEFASDLYGITHTNNRITHQIL